MISHQQSQRCFEAACQVIPGGVNSPVRACSSVDATPIFYKEAHGCHIVDVDGNTYLDFVSSWGPMIFGHAFEPVIEAVREALPRSTSYGAPCEAETLLAEKIVEMVPSIEQVRFVSSGTEATMTAIRLARGYTQRDKFIKFDGNYHGHSDALLAAAGSGVATLNIPGTPGVTQATVSDTLIARYNDLSSVRSLFEACPHDISSIIVEPVAGNMGVVPPQQGFLEGLRELCTQYGALLIFDEVITGFRMSASGAQGVYNIQPDITTFGKIIGAGLPVGALGGPCHIMQALAPVGPVYQAGTLSGNPLAMSAGLVMLEHLDNPAVYEHLNALGERLAQGLRQAALQAGVSAWVNQAGSVVTLFFCEGPVTNYDQAKLADTKRYAQWYQLMTERGFIVAPSQFEAIFISHAMTEEDIDAFIGAAAESLTIIAQQSA